MTFAQVQAAAQKNRDACLAAFGQTATLKGQPITIATSGPTHSDSMSEAGYLRAGDMTARVAASVNIAVGSILTFLQKKYRVSEMVESTVSGEKVLTLRREV